MANKLSVAFIGTGIMGAPIAGHILDAGYPVTVNNRTKSKAAALVERGAVWADTPADAAANADVVFTMVGYPSEVEELYLAGDGLLACTKPGAVLIDLTTSSPELARDIAEAAQVSGLDLAAHILQGTDTVQEGVFFMGDLSDLVFMIRRDPSSPLFYAACRNRSPCRSSRRNAASMSENRWVRLNFSDTFPGRAWSSSILAHSSGWWS